MAVASTELRAVIRRTPGTGAGLDPAQHDPQQRRARRAVDEEDPAEVVRGEQPVAGGADVDDVAGRIRVLAQTWLG